MAMPWDLGKEVKDTISWTPASDFGFGSYFLNPGYAYTHHGDPVSMHEAHLNAHIGSLYANSSICSNYHMPEITTPPEPTPFEKLSNHRFHELLAKFDEMKK